MGSGVRWWEMVSQPCPALAVGPWASDFTPSNLGFPICHMAPHLPSPRLPGGLKVTHADQASRS